LSHVSAAWFLLKQGISSSSTGLSIEERIKPYDLGSTASNKKIVVPK
jgi:hypothetical protein